MTQTQENTAYCKIFRARRSDPRRPFFYSLKECPIIDFIIGIIVK